MDVKAVANRYAESLYSVVEDKIRTLNFLHKTKEALNVSEHFRLVLTHPFIKKDDKLETLQEVIGIDLNKYESNFLKIIIDNHRVDITDRIYEEFKHIYTQDSGLEPVKLISAKKVPKEKLDRLKSILKDKTGKDIQIQTEINKELIGGIKIEIEDKVYDGSIKRVLLDFKDKVMKGVV